jgi:hypothetical protein
MIQPASDPKNITTRAAVINLFALVMVRSPLSPGLDEQEAKTVKISYIGWLESFEARKKGPDRDDPGPKISQSLKRRGGQAYPARGQRRQINVKISETTRMKARRRVSERKS